MGHPKCGVLNQFHHCIWVGDLNYRLDLSEHFGSEAHESEATKRCFDYVQGACSPPCTWTPNPERATLNPEPKTLNPDTRKREPETLILEHQTCNPKSLTRTPKPSALDS